jgi:hypothetical protein
MAHRRRAGRIAPRADHDNVTRFNFVSIDSVAGVRFPKGLDHRDSGFGPVLGLVGGESREVRSAFAIQFIENSCYELNAVHTGLFGSLTGDVRRAAP